jgi:hypothetical protein
LAPGHAAKMKAITPRTIFLIYSRRAD